MPPLCSRIGRQSQILSFWISWLAGCQFIAECLFICSPIKADDFPPGVRTHISSFIKWGTAEQVLLGKIEWSALFWNWLKRRHLKHAPAWGPAQKGETAKPCIEEEHIQRKVYLESTWIKWILKPSETQVQARIALNRKWTTVVPPTVSIYLIVSSDASRSTLYNLYRGL